MFIKFKYTENADNFISCLKPYPKVCVIKMSGQEKNKRILTNTKKRRKDEKVIFVVVPRNDIECKCSAEW